jgi:hypothetical protein
VFPLASGDGLNDGTFEVPSVQLSLIPVAAFLILGNPSLGAGEPPTTPASPTDLTPKPFTLQGEAPLSKALAALTEQTGNPVEDRRQTKTDPSLKLHFRQTPFWQALDTLARDVGARVSLHHKDDPIALVDGPRQEVPTSYSGWFRTRLLRLEAVRDLETQAHFYRAELEVAWEPRFQPYLLETGVSSLVMTDEKGQAAAAADVGTGKAAVAGRSELTFSLRLPALPRSAARIGLLKGRFSAVGPGSMLRFEFDQLQPIAQPDQARKQTQQGVTVELRELRVDENLGTFGLLVAAPAGGSHFESFQSWVGNNEIYLEKKRGGGRFLPNGGYESGNEAGSKVMLRYRFEDKPDKPVLDHLADWKLVYRTPGKIIEVPVPFEFKDLPLP